LVVSIITSIKLHRQNSNSLLVFKKFKKITIGMLAIHAVFIFWLTQNFSGTDSGFAALPVMGLWFILSPVLAGFWLRHSLKSQSNKKI
jgi:hypothetical protein